MSSATPRFTIVCPTYNRGPAIARTIESVQAQRMADWELVVASDASTDDTDDVVHAIAATDPRVRLLRTERYGAPAGPTNEAVAATDSELIAYVDHDDRWLPHHLDVLAAAFDDGADLVGTRHRAVRPDGSVIADVPLAAVCWHPELQVLAPLLHNSAAGHTRALLDTVGGWREGVDGLEDWDLWFRMSPSIRRCVTSSRVTVEIEAAPQTRQRMLVPQHAVPLAVFDQWRAARACLRAVSTPALAAELAQAEADDVREQYLRLFDDGTLVLPDGWRPSREDLATALAQPSDLGETETGHPARVRRLGYRFAVVLPIAVMDPRHEAAFARVFRATRPRLRALVAARFPDAVEV